MNYYAIEEEGFEQVIGHEKEFTKEDSSLYTMKLFALLKMDIKVLVQHLTRIKSLAIYVMRMTLITRRLFIKSFFQKMFWRRLI